MNLIIIHIDVPTIDYGDKAIEELYNEIKVTMAKVYKK